MNYEKLMSYNPSEYGCMVNSLGQEIIFVEHPIKGDEYPVIAVCHELKCAGATDFFELDDMMAEHKEYEPWFDTDDSNKLEHGAKIIWNL
jgi:hypothetical protein